MDKSICWDKWIDNYRHLAAPGTDTTQQWRCYRCGTVSQPVKTLAQIQAQLRAEGTLA